MKYHLIFVSIAAFLFPAAAFGQAFSNVDVIALTNADIGDDVILAKIDGLPCGYDVSTNAIVGLKSSGVTNRVIAAMVDRCAGAQKAQGNLLSSADPTIKRSPGIYTDRDPKPTFQIEKIRPININSASASGNGSLLFPSISRLSLPNGNSLAVAGGRPEFYFYFEADDAKVGDFGGSGTRSAQSPSEFNLVQFRVKKGERDLIVGKQTPFKARAGLDPKETIAVNITEIGDGIFKVTANNALVAGEYGFVLQSGSNSYRIYDFHITM